MALTRIGKCRDCKQTSRVTYTTTRTVTKRRWAQVGVSTYYTTYIQYGVIRSGFFTRAADDYTCPRCGAYAWNAKAIDGFKVDECPCDARCTNAKGPSCNCSCGGANHGAGHAVDLRCDSVALPA
jgi:hypothetical protein